MRSAQTPMRAMTASWPAFLWLFLLLTHPVLAAISFVSVNPDHSQPVYGGTSMKVTWTGASGLVRVSIANSPGSEDYSIVVGDQLSGTSLTFTLPEDIGTNRGRIVLDEPGSSVMGANYQFFAGPEPVVTATGRRGNTAILVSQIPTSITSVAPQSPAATPTRFSLESSPTSAPTSGSPTTGTNPSTGTPAQTQMPNDNGIPSTSQPPSPDAPPTEGPLGPKEKLGISIGGAILGLMIVFGVYLLWRRRAAHHHLQQHPENGMPPISGPEKAAGVEVKPIPQWERAELPAISLHPHTKDSKFPLFFFKPELDNDGAKYELSAPGMSPPVPTPLQPIWQGHDPGPGSMPQGGAVMLWDGSAWRTTPTPPSAEVFTRQRGRGGARVRNKR